MFKFNFAIDDENGEAAGEGSPSVSSAKQQYEAQQQPGGSNGKRRVEPCYDVSFRDLMEKLPSSISYSPLHLPFLPHSPLLRRDLFDARFQLAENEGEAGPSKRRSPPPPFSSAAAPTSDSVTSGTAGSKDAGRTELVITEEREEEYIDAKTDLIPGLYEGGLKTWEGGVDLVEVIHSAGDVDSWARGGRILEVGCGTAMPSCFILRSILSSRLGDANPPPRTILHLQDFNLPVLSLVTLPNLILATLPSLRGSIWTSDDGSADAPPAWDRPGEVNLTPALLRAVRKAWESAGVEFRFTYGHWSGLADSFSPGSSHGGTDERYDLIMTAETIYNPESLPDLIDVLRAAQHRRTPTTASQRKGEEDLERSLEDLRLKDTWSSTPLKQAEEGLVLVGAKVLYFGVGGDLHTFTQAVTGSGGWVDEVQAWTSGVGRKVVRVGW